MRSLAVGAVVGAAAIFAAAPADARSRDFDASLSATGSISVTWHGDQARGCAAAGLCGYRGSVSVEPVDGQLFLSFGRRGLLFADGVLDPESPSLARVQRREESGAVDTCVDASPEGEVEVAVNKRGRVARLGLAGEAITAGRCAGPDLTDALRQIRKRQISLARLKRGQTTIDFSGRVPFRSGHFSGVIDSTLRLHVGRVGASHEVSVGIPDTPRRARRFARVVELSSVYRITSFAGRFGATFRGLAEPACSGVDACGVSGAAHWAILSSGGTISIEANALTRGSDRGLRGLRAAVPRKGSRGFVAGFAELRHEVGATSARVERTGGATCQSSKSTLPPYLYVRSGRTEIPVALGSPRVFPMGPDPLRAGCPGPTGAAVVARHAIAVGRIPLADVGRRRIALHLGGAAAFDDGAYRGTWRSRFTLRLERVKQRLTYRFTRVYR
jgi:hypothetical protein